MYSPLYKKPSLDLETPLWHSCDCQETFSRDVVTRDDVTLLDQKLKYHLEKTILLQHMQ